VEREKETHTVWRGVGCLLIVIIPLISWVVASFSVGQAMYWGWPMPYQLTGYPVMPNILWKVTALSPVLDFIQRQENLYAIIALTLLFSVTGFAVISLAYSIVYRIVGPPRYGPLDAPPPSIKVGRYRR
jgi:hypothetical protein